MLLEVVAGEGF